MTVSNFDRMARRNGIVTPMPMVGGTPSAEQIRAAQFDAYLQIALSGLCRNVQIVGDKDRNLEAANVAAMAAGIAFHALNQRYMVLAQVEKSIQAQDGETA